VADVFCKFSLNVRITNCVRKNSWYELAGAVALTTLLGPVAADLAARFPGAAVLGEPGYRTVALPDTDAVEGLSVIFRDGLGPCLAPDVTPLLAAALTEQPGGAAGRGPAARGVPGALASDLFDGRATDWLSAWWEAYVRQVAPPVLHALFGHGIVFEPHLQNVLIGVDGDGLPVRAVLRDLEGVKLVTPRHDQALAALKPAVARALGYDEERGWHRVAYCLFVNHLAEVAAAIADRHPQAAEGFEAALWDRAREVLTGFARDHGWPPRLLAVLAGVPLPAKANLRLRWARGADREAAYVSVRNPLGGQLTSRETRW
jgi:siderophore synthetase component